MRILTVLVLILGLSGLLGCGKKPEQPARPEQPPISGGTVSQPAMVPGRPDDVIVSVDSAKLTRGEIYDEIELRVRAVTNRVPPEKVGMVRNQMGKHIIDQFIMRTLLLAEADRRGLQATEADQKQAYDRIAENLPEGMTVNDVLTNSPRGEAMMRSEVTMGIRINKLLAEEMPNVQEITDAEVDAFIEENKARLQVPENVRASHILITFEPEDDDEAKSAKRKQLEDIRAKIAAGADFADMAKEHSQDSSSKRGGDLGRFRRGQMVKPFEDAAFGQAVDELGPVVETKFGVHIIKVAEHNQPGLVPRDKIVERLRTQKRQKLTQALLDRLREKAKIEFRPSMRAQPVPGAELGLD